MARAPSTFRQHDVTRAIRAAAAAGVDIAQIEIDKAGKIVIILATGAPTKDSNPWDGVLSHDAKN